MNLLSEDKMEEHQDEVFTYITGNSKCLVVVDKRNKNVFKLKPHDCLGPITEEKKENMKSIGIFDLY